MTLPKSALCTIALGMALLAGGAAAQQSQPADRASHDAAPMNLQHEPAASKTEEIPGNKIEETPAVKAEETPAFQSRKEKLSYAFGLALAADMVRQRLNLDVEVVIRALKDAAEGKKLMMTGSEAAATLKTFEEDRQQDLDHAKKMISEKNKKAAEATFAENVKKEEIVTLPSGLQYKIMKQGDGKKPSLDDKVVCHYRVSLPDGKEFDSSYKHNKPAILPVKGMVKGWTEALQLMPVGSKWQLFIPPQIGYGERIVGGIGPNAMLVFEVELISIETGDKAGARPAEGINQEPVLASGSAKQ